MVSALSLASPNNVGSMKQMASAFVQATAESSEITTSSAVSLFFYFIRFPPTLTSQLPWK